MGGTAQPPTSLNNFNRQDWNIIYSKSHVAQFSEFKNTSQKLFNKFTFSNSNDHRSKPQNRFSNQLQSSEIHLINRLTGQEILQYNLQCDQDQYRENMNFYNFRRQNFDCMIAPKYIQVDSIDQLCCKCYSLKIYIQSISLRLSDINQIPFKDSLYILKNCLEGYHKIFEKIQIFEVHEELIGITSEGAVKVWIHSDFSKNWPLNSQLSTCQSALVLKIIKIIEKRIVSDSSMLQSPLSGSKIDNKNTKNFFFSQFLRKNDKKSITFEQTKKMLNKFAKTQGVQIPNYFTSILKRIRADKGINESQMQIITKQKMKQSDVFPLQLGIMKFKLSNFYSSYARSDSSATYADLLNSQASKHKHNKIKKSNIVNFPTTIVESLELTGMRKQLNLPYQQNRLQKNRDRNKQYFTTSIQMQNSWLSSSKFNKISEAEESMVRSKISEKSHQTQKLDIKSKSQIEEKEHSVHNKPGQFNRIIFTYRNNNNKDQLPAKSTTIKKQTKQHKIKDKQINNFIDTKIVHEERTTTYGDRNTFDDDFQLDPEILADLRKYQIEI